MLRRGHRRHLGDIGTGDEDAPGTGQDDDAHGGIGFQFLHDIRQPPLYVEVEGVAAFRPVDRQNRDAIRRRDGWSPDFRIRSRSRSSAVSSNPFDDGGNPLPDADAHGAERTPGPPQFEFPHRGQHQPDAAHAERMAKRYRAAVRIDMLGVLGQAKLPENGDALSSEGFVEFDQVDFTDPDARAGSAASGSPAPVRSP